MDFQPNAIAFSAFFKLKFQLKTTSQADTLQMMQEFQQKMIIDQRRIAAIEKIGGEAGDHKEQCSFEYDIFDFPKMGGDKPIEKAFDLNAGDSKFKRPGLGKFKEADFGIALWDDDKLNVIWCNEVMEIKSCSSENDDEKEEV